MPDLGPVEHWRAEQRRWVYYVSTSGNDSNDGLSSGTAFATIQHAINTTDEMDTVEVLPGTYTGVGNKELDFFGNNIALRSSDGPDVTILDLENNGRAFTLAGFEPQSARVGGFTIVNGNTESGGAIYLMNSSVRFYNMMIKNCASGGSGGALYAQNSGSRFINCILTNNSSDGDAGVAKIVGGDVAFKHCTIANNQSADDNGLVFDGGSHIIKNSVYWYNNVTGNGIMEMNGASLDISFSNIMGGYDGPGMLNHRPGFVDANLNDFDLEDWSPMIGAADTSNFSSLDFVYNERSLTDTTAPDIGAYESDLAEPDTSNYISQTWNVNTNGDDANDGSEFSPFGTIQRAVDYAVWDDNISIQPGTYSQEMDLWGKDILLSGTGDPFETEIVGHISIIRGGSPFFTKLKLRNDGITVQIEQESEPEFNYVEFSGSTAGPVVEIAHAAPDFNHVTFADNTADAINASDTSQVTVFNTIFWNTANHYEIGTGSTISVDYSLTDSAGTENISADPHFIGTGDYHLLASSLCVNGGDPIETDNDGSRIDIGAYPYLSSNSGPDWYVETTGSDIDGDGTELNPFASVQAGINFATNNDTVFVSPGQFYGTAQLRSEDIVIQGNGDETVLDGNGEGPVLFVGDGLTAATQIQDMTITGAPADAAVYCGASSVHLTHLNITGNGQGIYLDDASPTVDYCRIVDNTTEGIKLSNTSTGVISTINNTIANNGNAGCSNNSSASFNIRNSIVWGNSSSLGGVFSVTYSDIHGGYTGSGNIDADPMFVGDSANNDTYALGLLSPCVDTGDPNDTFDADSTIRDMGALPLFRTFVGGNSNGENVVVGNDTTVVVDSDLVIDVGDSLIIEPGSILYLGNGVTLTINGILSGNGNAMEPISFTTLYPGEFFNGIVLQGTTGERVDSTYEYIAISNVAPGAIPLTIVGDAVLHHVTIAGNDRAESSLTTDGNVSVFYSIFESTTSVTGVGVVNTTDSFVDDTTQFVDFSGGDFHLLATSPAIDVGAAEVETDTDPDFTYTDAGVYYHDQSSYPTSSATVTYPSFGDTVEVSPDSSALIGLDVYAQTFNQYNRFKTNPAMNWDVNTVLGLFETTITDTSDLDGESVNIFKTNTLAGSLNQFTVSSDGVNATSGVFRVVPGAPDSVALVAQSATEMTQLDTLELEVSVFDQFDNLVSDGEQVLWSIAPIQGDGSGFAFVSDITTTVSGQATVVLVTDPNTSLTVGHSIQVQAQSGIGTVFSDTITVVPDDIFNLSMADTLTQESIDLDADIHSLEISATMIDTFDNPLSNVEIFWDLIDLGSPDGLLSDGSTFTDQNGVASITLTTGTVTDYQYQVRGWVTEQALMNALQYWTNETVSTNREIVGINRKDKKSVSKMQIPVTVSPSRTADFSREAIYDLDDTTAVIRVVPGASSAIAFDLAGDTVITQLESLPLQATVTDQYGNLVADGTVVDWSYQPTSTGISLEAATSITANGIATNTLFSDPTSSLGTSITVSATSGSASMTSNSITVVPDDPYTLAVTDSYNRNPVADLNTVPLEVTITDTFNNTLSGIPVYWEILTGFNGFMENYLQMDTTLTDASGMATNTLTTGVLSDSTYTVRTWVDNTGGYTGRLNSRVPGDKPVHPKDSGELTVKQAIKKGDATVHEERSLPRSEFSLDDTTDVITVLPGAPSSIAANRPDSIYVIQGQVDTLTITVFDQFDNLVSDGSSVNWQPTGSTDFINNTTDNATTNGQASVQYTVSESATWLAQLDLNIEVTSIFNANTAVDTIRYIVEDVIAPAPVSDLTIDPTVWTSTNSFTLSWTNPPEHSGVAGVFYQVDSNSPAYVESSDITSTVISLPTNANSTISVWLQDNAGNEDAANLMTTSAKWDDVAPESFDRTAPASGIWLNTSHPIVTWTSSSDAVAGLDHYRVILDGTPVVVQPDSNQYTISTPPSEDAHTLTIFAVDSAGNETEVTDGEITFNVDFTLPNIVHNQVLEGTENQVLSIAATSNDPASGVSRLELFYRQGGETSWSSPVNLSSGNYNIASSFVKSTGVEYYLECEDVAGNIRRVPEEGYYSVSVTIPTGIPSSRQWPTGIPSGTTVADYQLISFPANPANNTPTDVLVSNTVANLGSYDDTKWRFFTYASNAWIEFANISNIESGVGYFLIVKDGGQNINTGQASSVSTDEPFSITLPVGEWVMLGNPFDFDIPLANIYDQDSVTMVDNPNFHTWDGDWVNATALKPWQGYIYKSANGGQLYINPRKQNGGQARWMQNEADITAENEWLVDIDVQNGFGNDRHNRVGVLSDAVDTYDKNDAFEPPLAPGGVSLRIDNSSWEKAGDLYTTDIKSITEEGHFWDLSIVAQDKNSNVETTFEGLSDIPEDFDIFLIDKSIGTAQNLKSRDTYTYPAGVHQREFRLVVGTREFAQEHNAGIALYPEAFELSQNFPNPFNPKTTILISVEDEAVVNLVVYNLLGETIATLAHEEYLQPGYYSYIWSGNNDLGNKVASGLYLYSTVIKSPSGKILLNQTRKMIFVK